MKLFIKALIPATFFSFFLGSCMINNDPSEASEDSQLAATGSGDQCGN